MPPVCFFRIWLAKVKERAWKGGGEVREEEEKDVRIST